MLQPYRQTFNQRQFSPTRYAELLTSLNRLTRTEIQFRIAETPGFFPRALLEQMAEIGRQLTHQLIDDPAYLARADAAIPPEYRVPNDTPRPHFMTADFGLVRDENNELQPKLVELQAFPSIFGYQEVACEQYRSIFGLDSTLAWRPGGLSSEAYWSLLSRTILADHDPENVVLMEIEPESQKTLPDFHVHQDRLGIPIVDVARIKREGNRLFYNRRGVWVPIERIYNRAIVDEWKRKNIHAAFDLRDDLAVEWAGQPNWYFRISKFSLPFLKHPSVPAAVFLDQWFAGDRDTLPRDREQLILKPLYSFAGRGIQFAPTDRDLAAIPRAERSSYLLQERVHFEPVIATPQGPTQAEIRVMYVWPEGAPEMIPVTHLLRLGRGLMMGVDHNREQAWVGGSAVFFPES